MSDDTLGVFDILGNEDAGSSPGVFDILGEDEKAPDIKSNKPPQAVPSFPSSMTPPTEEVLTPTQAQPQDLGIFDVLGEDEVSPFDKVTASSEPSAQPASGFNAFVEDYSTHVTDDNGYLSSIIRGLKSATISPLLEKEDVLAERSLGTGLVEGITDAVTNIAIGAGLTAAGAEAGAILGTIVAPGAGTAAGAGLGGLIGVGLNIAYGIYNAVGQEYSRAQALERDFDPKIATLSSIIEVNPLIKGSKKVIQALRVATQGLATYGVSRELGSDKTAAMFAGTVGMAFMAPTMIKTKPTKKMLADTAEFLQEDAAGVMQEAMKKRALIDTTYDPAYSHTTEFMKFMTQKDIRSKKTLEKRFNEIMETYTPEKAEEYYQSFIMDKLVTQAAAERASQKLNTLGEGIRDPLIPGFNWIQPMKFIARATDDATGLNGERIMDGLSEGQNMSGTSAISFAGGAKKAVDFAKKNKLSQERIAKILNGNFKASSPKEIEAVEMYRGVYDSVRNYARSMGHVIGDRENYLNMEALDAPDLYNKALKQFDSIKEMIGQTNAKSLDDLVNKLDRPATVGLTEEIADGMLTDINELKGVLTNRFNEAKNLNTLEGLKINIDKILDVRENKIPTTHLSAAFHRHGEMPDAYRKWDAGANLASYINSTMKTIHMGKSISELNTYISALKAMGMNKSASAFESHLKTVMGHDSYVTAAIGYQLNKARAGWKRIIEDEDLGGISKLPAHAKAFTYDFLSYAVSMPYSRLLGLNPMTLITNNTQVFQKTVPELGYAYGSKLLMQTIPDIVKRPKGGMEKYLTARAVTGETSRFVEDMDIISPKVGKDYKIMRTVKWGNDAMDKVFMAPYAAGETAQRYLSYRMGYRWGQDVVKGDQAAIRALKRASTARKVSVDMLMRNKGVTKFSQLDPDELGDLLGKAVVSDTQFHFGKTQISRGAQAMGSTFRMFTTFPSMVMGEAVYTLQKGVRNGNLMTEASKYAFKTFPALGLLAGAQMALDTYGTRDQRELATYLFGRDLKGMHLTATLNPSTYTPYRSPVFNIMSRTAIDAVGVASFSKSPKAAAETLIGNLKGFNPIWGAPILNEVNRFKKAFQGRTLYDEMISR